jgi:hypothetical protein
MLLIKSTLPDMATPFVVPMVTADMRCHPPLHPATQVSVTMRPQDQVKMVTQQVVPRQSHGNVLMGLAHQVHESGKVIVFVKYIATTIPSIEDTLDKSAL